MGRSSNYRIKKAVAVVLLVALITFGSNYFLRLGMLGLVGRGAKSGFLVAIGLGIVYCMFFAPTRQEMEQHKESKRIAKSELQ